MWLIYKLEVVNLYDVWMMKGCNELSFVHEVRNEIRFILKISIQELDCHITLQLGVTSLPHFTHPAASQTFEQFVFAISLSLHTRKAPLRYPAATALSDSMRLAAAFHREPA